jgi:hypothetical protein
MVSEQLDQPRARVRRRPPPDGDFIRGNANDDNKVNIADPIDHQRAREKVLGNRARTPPTPTTTDWWTSRTRYPITWRFLGGPSPRLLPELRQTRRPTPSTAPKGPRRAARETNAFLASARSAIRQPEHSVCEPIRAGLLESASIPLDNIQPSHPQRAEIMSRIDPNDLYCGWAAVETERLARGYTHDATHLPFRPRDWRPLLVARLLPAQD